LKPFTWRRDTPGQGYILSFRQTDLAATKNPGEKRVTANAVTGPHAEGRNDVSNWDFTPKSSGPHRRNRPQLSSGKLAIVALCLIFTIIVLTYFLTPPLWK
jgi:hypothetical protein